MKLLLVLLLFLALRADAQKSIGLKTDVTPTGQNKRIKLPVGGGTIVMPYNRGVVNVVHIIPAANAGGITTLQYTSASLSTTLTGTATDAATTQWQQVAGPTSATITAPGALSSSFTGLNPGLYTFRLAATSSTGDTVYDTAYISVLKKITWTVDGLTRTALVHIPINLTTSNPLLVAFHGHKSSSISFADKAFEVYWENCVVVYPQGLPTPSPSDPPGDYAGWQRSTNYTNPNYPGHVDIDIAFFDTIKNYCIRNYNVDATQLFAHGWSNGGEYIYDALWVARGSLHFAGLSSAAANLNDNNRVATNFMHIAGTADDKISFTSQSNNNIPLLKTINGCTGNGTIYITGNKGLLGKKYTCSSKAFAWVQYDSGHDYPDLLIPPVLVAFFKEQINLQ